MVDIWGMVNLVGCWHMWHMTIDEIDDDVGMATYVRLCGASSF